MSEITPVGQSNIRAATGQAPPLQAKREVGPPDRTNDQVELSVQSQFLAKLADMPDVRQELVGHVRAEIEAGTYDTLEKVDQLLDELAQDLG